SLQFRDFDPVVVRGLIWIHDAFLPPQPASGSETHSEAEGGAAIFEGYVKGVLTGLLDDDDLSVRIQWASQLDAEGQILLSDVGPQAAGRCERDQSRGIRARGPNVQQATGGGTGGRHSDRWHRRRHHCSGALPRRRPW